MQAIKSYAEVKVEFEKTHFKLENPFCFCQIIDEDIIIRSKDEIRSLYDNLYFMNEEITVDKNGNTKSERKKKQFVSVWFLDTQIKTYRELVFEPCKQVKSNQFNIWRGWKASKLPQSTLKFEDSKMYQHMKYMFSETFDFQCQKIAYILQTGNKTDVADVLYSDPGTGKDTYYNYIGNNIFGKEYYLNEDYIDMILGDSFNDVISRKVLIVLNESKRAKTDDIIEAIKNAITREDNWIRGKNVKPRREVNYINWATLTNSYDSIRIEPGDRRFEAEKVGKKYKGNTLYFNALYDEIKSGKYDRACFDFFMNMTITIKSFQNERPLTSYYLSLQERNIPVHAQFLINIMQTETGDYKETATKFYERYILFLKENGYEFKTNTTKFGLDMKQYPVVQKVDTNKYRIYKINIQELQEYLIKEKLYVVTEEVDDKVIVHKKIEDVQDQINEIENDKNNLNLEVKRLAKRIEYVNDSKESLMEELANAVDYIKYLEKLLNIDENEKQPTKKTIKPKKEVETLDLLNN